MTEFVDPSEELDPIEKEALARVRHLGSGLATRKDIEDTKHWGRQSAAQGAALARASLLWDRLGPAGRNFLQRTGEAVLPDWAPAPRLNLTRRAMLAGALTASAAAAYLAIRPPLELWPSVTDLLADYHTAAGEQRKLTISDNIEVTLNTGTSLNVRSHDMEGDQIEIVNGEVAVATGTESKRKVVVLAGDGRAIALQARFNVRHDRLMTCITCLDGELEVERHTSTVMLKAGQQVTYIAQGLADASAIDPASISAWQSGLLVFHYVPLMDAVAEINRYRRGRVLVMNAELGRRVVNGRFRIDNVDSVLATFEQIFGAKITRLPGGIVLLS
jgi:transmembrane sensor